MAMAICPICAMLGGIAGGIPPGGMEPPLMRLSRTMWGSGAWRESGYGEGWRSAAAREAVCENDGRGGRGFLARGSPRVRARAVRGGRGVRPARTTRRARYPRGRARPRLPAETENARVTGPGAHLTAARQDVRTHGPELELRRRLTAGRGVGGHPRGRDARGGVLPLRRCYFLSSSHRGEWRDEVRAGSGAARAWGHAAGRGGRSIQRDRRLEGGETSNGAGGTARDGRT